MSHKTQTQQNQADYRAFVDGGSFVPYFISDGVYKVLSSINLKSDYIDFENKQYFKDGSNNYYVGVVTSNYARLISASEYKYVKEKTTIKKSKFHKGQKTLFD